MHPCMHTRTAKTGQVGGACIGASCFFVFVGSRSCLHLRSHVVLYDRMYPLIPRFPDECSKKKKIH